MPESLDTSRSAGARGETLGSGARWSGSLEGHGGAEGLRTAPSGRYGIGLLWLILAGGAAVAADVFGPAAGPGAAGSNDFFGPSGGFQLGLGLVGLALVAAGVLVYGLRRGSPPAARGIGPRFTAHTFLCTLGAVCVLLHTGFELTGSLSLLTWSVMSVVLSICAGRYLLGWLPVTHGGQPVEPSVVGERRQELLQRLWTMTDVPPHRLDELLGREVPRGEFGPLRALEISLRYRLRVRLRRRRVAAAVAILDVPKSIVPEAQSVVAEQARLLSIERLGSPLGGLVRIWQRVHLPLGVATTVLLAARLAALAFGGESWTL